MDERCLVEPRIDLLGRPTLQLPGSARAGRAVLAAPPGPFVPHRARELTLAACRAWHLDAVAESAGVVSDELVTNAVIHAQTFLELHIAAGSDGEIVLAVHDRDPSFDPGWWDRPSGSDTPGGARYGLRLARELANRYGAFQHAAGGKVIWAALTAGSPDQPGALASTARARDRTKDALPLRRTIAVNGARRASSQRNPWRLDLLLGWLPQEPDHVDLTLRPTALHPGLPQGNWRTAWPRSGTG